MIPGGAVAAGEANIAGNADRTVDGRVLDQG